ncbi:MAG: N-acetylmuramoyl-L-alanine amidase [Caulobacteraceae bacterium]|nr:N-acetylmuramoyl-L-alanine amidase [Caulobacteraceae bacterium]
MRARIGRVFSKTSVRVAAVFTVATAGALSIVAASQAEGSPGVRQVRLGGDSSETRVVVDLDRRVSGKVTDGDGREMAITLSGVRPGVERSGGGRGLVRGWSLDEAGGGTRLKLDLTADAEIKGRFLLPPADGVNHYRYVIDLRRAGQASERPAAPVVRMTALNRKKVIVIDAGHGGKDPGALGPNHQEKTVTLAAAKALKSRLEQTGRYKVVLTRGSDVYVPLENRVHIARRADADLFISLHADSGPTNEMRGASVYTLSDGATARSAKFIKKDDWFVKASLTGGQGVGDILLDLTQRMTRNRSAQFAEVLLDRVDDHSLLLRRSHRDAGLVVLLAPDVPAVLLEMGFINNPQDEKLLASASYREKLMGGVAKAIDDYFGSDIKLAAR